MYREAHLNVIKDVHLSFENFPKGFGEIRLFFISDIHKREVSRDLLETVTGKVDLIVIGGDLTERGVPLKRVEENIKKLKALGPCYFVWGNNDYEVDYRELDSLLLSHGVKILDNTAVSFESSEGDQVSLVGIDDISKERDNLELALSDAEPSSFKILVSHNPQIRKKLKKEHGISLVLCGHTHGGQIRLGKWGLYNKGGIFNLDITTLFISNGYGTTAVPLRLGAPAETHLIKITNKLV
jgi:predicted MPP superfamily phosphohydrolase